MEPNPYPTSFSAGRRWGIFFSVLISVAAVTALVGMLNYLGARHFHRFSWSAKTSPKLSPRTLGLLQSITNDVKIVVYYDTRDQHDAVYGEIVRLLTEYHLANPNISVQSVDYKKDAGTAEKIKALYGLGEDKNLLIFDCGGRRRTVSGDVLATYTFEERLDDSQLQASGQPKVNVLRHLKDFNGEMIVDAYLLSVVKPKQLVACYLLGHGEAAPDGQGDREDRDFMQVLVENNLLPIGLSLAGTNLIPAECNVLIIAGPRRPLPAEELAKIKQYLEKGGRMFVLFNSAANGVETGLESLLADWGVGVGRDVVADPENSTGGAEVVISHFNTRHALINPLGTERLEMFEPRSIRAVADDRKPGDSDSKAVELAWTGPNAIVSNFGTKLRAASVPVMAAVEKNNTKGGITEGVTRLVVVGDSRMLENWLIKAGANRDFAGFAVNWLVDETELMAGVGPKKMVEYNLNMTQAEMTTIRWIFLGAMPGGVLLFGGLVWLRRRQ